MNQIFSLLIGIIVSVFISACGSEDLANDPNIVVPQSILSANISSLSINANTSSYFSITAKKEDGTTDTVSVISSDSNVCTVSIINSDVTVNAKSLGSANITIISGSGNILNIPVSIIETSVATLSVDKLSFSMEDNASANIIVTATTDGVTPDTITAVSSNTAVLTVLVIENNITITSHNVGSAAINILSSSGKSITCNIDVLSPGEATLVLSKESLVITEGNAGTLTAIATLDGINEDNISVTSSDTNILTLTVVENDIVVTTKNAGTAIITVTSGSNLIKTCNVSVEAVQTTLTVGTGYITDHILNDNGVVYSLSVEYGKSYEIWVKDALSQATSDYHSVDAVISVYSQDKTKIYLSREDQVYSVPKQLNPIEAEQLYIHVEPSISGEIGTYSIEVVEKTSLHEGMKVVPFSLKDGIIKNSKVSNEVSVNNWSYYTTEVIASTTKTISIDNISPTENLAIKVYEDENCTAQVNSATSAATGSVSLSHTYSKSGTFCIAVNNISLLNSATYDISINGNKAAVGTTYTSNELFDIPDNNLNGVLSTIEVEYGILNISNVKVTVNIKHPFVNDLSIYVTSPTGIESVLSTSNGGSGDNYTSTVFDDAATVKISEASAPFTGSFLSESPLSIYKDEDPNGVWTLKVVDDTPGDTGRIESWSIVTE